MGNGWRTLRPFGNKIYLLIFRLRMHRFLPLTASECRFPTFSLDLCQENGKFFIWCEFFRENIWWQLYFVVPLHSLRPKK